MDLANWLATNVRDLGFPIVVCAALIWYLVFKDNRHAEEMDKMRTVIENNTLAVTRLLDKLNEEV